MRKRAIKTMLLTGLMIGAMAVSAVVSADTYTSEWSVYYTEKSKMDDSSFNSEAISQKLSQMEPGDTAVFTIYLQNKNDVLTKWYMENQVMKTLEEGAAENGAYTYQLLYTNDQTNAVRDLTDEEGLVGGGDPDAGDNNSTGMLEATSGLDEWFYLDDLKKGEKGHVSLTVELEGESQNNDYQDKLARLRMRFGVEEKGPLEPTNVNKVNKIVQTGDTSQSILYLAMIGVAGLFLLLLVLASMKRRKAEMVESTSARKGGRRDA